MSQGEDPQRLSDRTIRGVLWLVTSRLSMRLCDFITLVVLGKLLSPADFGLVAIAMTLVTIIDTISEFPVGQALLRLPRIDAPHLHTALTLGLIRGLIVAGVLGALAWPFARLYGDNRLALLIIALAIAPATRGLVSPGMTLFAKNINFTRDFIMESTGKVAAMMISVAIAAMTRSYWAVAAATITAPVVMILMSYVLAPHRVGLSVREWRVFHGFLGWNTGAQLINVLNWQCDKLILGRLVSKAALGGFSLADSVSSLPAQALIAPLLRPVLAAFSHLNGDIERLRQAYAKVGAAVLTIGLPPILAIGVLTDPIVRLLLGPKWLIAVPILKIIVLGGIARLITAPLQPLAMALNRNKVFFIRSSWELVVKLPVMILAVWHYGVMGAVWVRLAMGVYNLMVEMTLVKRLIDIRLVDQLAPLWRIALSGAAMAAAMAWTGQGLADAQGPVALLTDLALAGLAGSAAYVLGLLVLWRLAGRPAGLEADVTVRVASLLQPAGRTA